MGRRLRPARRGREPARATRTTIATIGPRPGSRRSTASSPPEGLYARSGLQFLPFTTLYQLAAARGTAAFDAARTMLLMPDLIGYLAVGRHRHRAHERLDHRPARRPSPGVGPGADGLARSPGDAVRAARRAGRRHRSAAGRRPARDRHVGGHAADARRVARHGLRRRRGPGRRRAVRVHRVRDVGARRRRARGPDPDRGEPPGQLHQRGRGGRADPLPPQRHGPVAAPGVAPDVGARGHPGEPAGAAQRGGRPAAGRTGLRAGRSGVPGTGRHAGPDRRRLPSIRPARAARPRRARPRDPRQPRRGIRPGGPGRCPPVRASRWRSSTSSAAAPGTPFSAS